MLSQKFTRITESPVLSAVTHCGMWAAVLNLLFIISEKIVQSMGLYMLSFGFIYPVCALVINFRYGKRHGVRWYYCVAELVIMLAEFLLIADFREITPNIIVMTVLCLLFGTGIGGCFCDEQAVKTRDESRIRKKNKENAEYKNILDDSDGK